MRSQRHHGSFVSSSFQISETSGGHPRSSPQRRVTPEETRAHPCQRRAPPHLCSSPHTGSLCSQARGPTTADRVPTGVAPTATLPPLGHSGRAALGQPRVSRAGGRLPPPQVRAGGCSFGGGGLCSERVGWVSRTQERDSRAVVPELPSLGRTGDLASSPSH